MSCGSCSLLYFTFVTTFLLIETYLNRLNNVIRSLFRAIKTGSHGKFYLHIPAGLNGMNLVEVHSEVITAGNGSTVDVQLHNVTHTADMLSTSLTINSTKHGSDEAGTTAAVINTSEDDVATNDLIRIDVDGNGGDTTIAKGLIVTLGFRIP